MLIVVEIFQDTSMWYLLNMIAIQEFSLHVN